MFLALSLFFGSVHDAHENPFEAELGLPLACPAESARSCCCCLCCLRVSMVDWLICSRVGMVGWRMARLMSSRIWRSFTMLTLQSGLWVTLMGWVERITFEI